jgi:hypothetical protein
MESGVVPHVRRAATTFVTAVVIGPGGSDRPVFQGAGHPAPSGVTPAGLAS